MEITSKNVEKIKSIQRIHESMKMYVHSCSFMNIEVKICLFINSISVVNLLIFEEMRSDIAPLLPNFLAHMFPKVCPRMNLFTFAELIIR